MEDHRRNGFCSLGLLSGFFCVFSFNRFGCARGLSKHVWFSQKSGFYLKPEVGHHLLPLSKAWQKQKNETCSSTYNYFLNTFLSILVFSAFTPFTAAGGGSVERPSPVYLLVKSKLQTGLCWGGLGSGPPLTTSPISTVLFFSMMTDFF